MDDVRYALGADGSHVAYCVLPGDPERTLVLVTSGTLPMSAIEEDPVGRRLLEGLTRLGSLVLFDRRGVGLSDPLPTADESPRRDWSRDIAAVVEAAGLERPDVVVAHLPDPVVLHAAERPDRVGKIVILEPNLTWLWLTPHEQRDVHDLFTRNVAGDASLVELLCPTRADDEVFRGWFDRVGRSGASPSSATRVFAPPTGDEIEQLRAAYASVTCEIVLLHRPRAATMVTPDRVRNLLSAASVVELPGRDSYILGEELDSMLAEIGRFIAGEVRLPPPDRLVVAILFTDLVGSTAHLHDVGDRRWRSLIDAHDEESQQIVERLGGSIVDTTGDGVVAVLPSAAGAVRAACEIRRVMRGHGVAVRAGIHVGDVDKRKDDLSGLSMNVSARIMALADADEILASESAVLAAAGESRGFTEKGRHPLKGLPGEWRVYRYRSGDNAFPS
jgi:class 3 adenylate cyclase